MKQELYRQIKKLYVEDKKTMQEIQDITGINRKEISKILKEQNITSRFRISDLQLKEAEELYKKGKSFTEIAKIINCDRHCIATKLKEKEGKNRRELTENEIKIIEEYENGATIKQIANKYNIKYKTMQDFIRTNDVKRHTIKKCKCNENIFEIIDTEEKAYWLGFLYADGYVDINKGIELTLKAKDLNHIEKFQSFMNSNHKISYRKNVHAYRINITSQKIASDLTRLGCFQNKSLTLEFPTEEQVPKHLIHHFMRGYFDGDGCVCINKEKKYYSFSVLGTESFLNEYENLLLKFLNKTSKTKRTVNGKALGLQLGGRKQLKNIYNFLYKDANIYLDRKFEKFAVLNQNHKKIQDD